MLIPVKINNSIEIQDVEIENTNFKSLNLREEHIVEFLRKNIEVIFQEETLLVVGKQVVNKENGRSDLTACEKASRILNDFLEKNNALKTFNSKQSIILIASSFDKQTLSATAWLISNNVDISCFELSPMKIAIL